MVALNIDDHVIYFLILFFPQLSVSIELSQSHDTVQSILACIVIAVLLLQYYILLKMIS